MTTDKVIKERRESHEVAVVNVITDEVLKGKEAWKEIERVLKLWQERRK